MIPWPGRVEDVDLLTGKAKFGGDLTVEGALWVGFVRAPVAHGEITAIHTADAEAINGVVGVFTATDLDLVVQSGLEGVAPVEISRPPLASDKVTFVGEAVAAVVATNAAIAADACDLVAVDYEPRAPVPDLATATAANGPVVHPGHDSNVVITVPSGDYPSTQAALEDSAVTVTVAQHYPRVACAPIEGVAASVVPSDAVERGDAVIPSDAVERGDAVIPSDAVTVCLNTQMPALCHDDLAATLNLADDQLSLVVPPIGGGFGGKCTGENGIVAVAAHLALKLGRPLRLAQSRPENLLSMQARDQHQHVVLGADKDGTVTALVAEITANVGSYAGMGAFEPLQTQRLIPGPYRIDQVAVTAQAVMTNTVPTGPYRGPGRAEAIGLMERAMDSLARALDIDPADIRRRNLLRPQDFPRTMPAGLVMDEADHLGALERALAEVDYPRLRAEQKDRRAAGSRRLPGIGICCWADFTGRHEPCHPVSARVGNDGRIEIDAGVAPMGQGILTVVSRLAADALGLDLNHIRAVAPDTGRFRSALGSFGSRSASLAGSSTVQAATQLRDELLEQVAERLEASTKDIELRPDGTLGVRGVPAASVPLADLAGIEVTAAYDQGQATFPGGTHIATVEVDTETGAVEITRHVAVTDCGRVLDEVLAAGQVQGGAAQGIAVALFEEMRYDAEANPLTTSLADYLMPAAPEVPPIETVFIETPTNRNPLGAKGVGESGTIAAPPAVQNAIIDALAPLGVTHIDMPCGPERIWQAIRNATPR